MKPFFIWIVITLLVFVGISGAYHLYLQNNPRRILVALDSSFSMKSVWNQVPDILKDLEQQRYTMFSLVTEKNKIHSWSPSLNLDTLVPYAPRNFSKLLDSASYPEINEAKEKFLITNREGAQSENMTGWTVVQLPL